jgi:hypothetical protein
MEWNQYDQMKIQCLLDILKISDILKCEICLQTYAIQY